MHEELLIHSGPSITVVEFEFSDGNSSENLHYSGQLC